MRIGNHDIGVCSWSLQPKTMADLLEQVRKLGLEHIQLGFQWIQAMDEATRSAALAQLKSSNIKLTGGMMSFPGEDYTTIASIRRTGGYVPDSTWESRRAQSLDALRLAQELGIKTIGTHVGFVPTSDDPGYSKIVDRVREIAEPFAAQGVDLLLETGQEPASELLQFFNDVRARNVGINFDPANMILYGAGEPIEAIRTLGRHIRHVHVKDAVPSDQPGVKWGTEVPFGTGEVRPGEFVAALDASRYGGPLVIEREGGDDRFGDVKIAIEALKNAVK
ncbi:MAG TPA: sugar phosphate isomerase/epimerase family protein [Tepidisphaeraceae bacterium]|nr:sugar phosphate isomerase/epimerase family protein [Tepidisphaeraceae bacterium]